MPDFSYSSYMEELSEDDIYEGLLGYGLFSEKLPSCLTSKSFYQFCKDNPDLGKYNKNSKTKYKYIKFESRRNTNVPREFGIPSPFAYNKLCSFLSKNWAKLKEHFTKQTSNQAYCISRIHIRKQKNSKAIFKMSYNNWKTDGNPELNAKIGAKYVVSADISTCFPSIYSHALPWAIIGKDEAKKEKTNNNQWYNQLDALTRMQTNNETHGILIGPHASNLISEIILTNVDSVLKNWNYIRNIDDYTCYVESYEKGQEFIAVLTKELHKYSLQLNSKKTKIQSLPSNSIPYWVNKLNRFTDFNKLPPYKAVQFFLDEALLLMKENENNSAILKYAIKVISKKKDLSKSAIQYYIKTVFHFTLIYPYLVSTLEECLFFPYGKFINPEDLSSFINKLYDSGMKTLNYEAAYYAIYFSIFCKKRYSIGEKLTNLKFDNISDNENCILLLFAYLHAKEFNMLDEIEKYKQDAKDRMKKEQDEYWLYWYEVLSASELSGDWKYLKKNKISFISWENIEGIEN